MSSLVNKLIFKKFQVKKLLYTSIMSKIYEGLNEITKEPVAMKFEKIGGKFELLESEAYFLLLLKGFGIPRLISFGKNSNYKILVEELLGPSIYFILDIKDNKTRLNDVCLIALQILDRLEYIHSKNVIHKDIKPFNFIFGKKDPNILYIIDFGLSKKYRSTRTGKHIKFNKIKQVDGSFRYMSINCNRGYEQSRKDDLESLGYMLIYLAKQYLPWSDIVDNLKENENVRILETLAKKVRTRPEELCSGLPLEFAEYIKYCRKLEFEDDPNYNYLKHLFITILNRNGELVDERYINLIQFSWLKKKKSSKLININEKSTSYSKFSGPKKRKESIYKRLYKKIKESIDVGKSMELPKEKGTKFYKFSANNICTTPSNVLKNYKKKIETDISRNNGIRKITKIIIENKSNKSNIKVKPKITKKFTAPNKIFNPTIPNKKYINNNKIINELRMKTKFNDFFNSTLDNNKILHPVFSLNDSIDINNTGEYTLNSYSKDQQNPRFYKSLKERNEMKKHRKKRYIPITNKHILPTNYENKEKKIIHIKRNNFKPVQICKKNLEIFDSTIISLRKEEDLYSSNINYTQI